VLDELRANGIGQLSKWPVSARLATAQKASPRT